MIERHTMVRADYYQYYALAAGGDFDTSSVDMANDGILAPAEQGVRISTGVQLGDVDLTVRVLDGPLSLPAENPGVIASACTVHLPHGRLAITDWGGPTVFEHEFGRPLVCALLVQVEGRDEALDHRYDQVQVPPERHLLTLSPVPLSGGRWRTARMDRAGAALETFTDHVASAG
ncbi:hypothetical protein [Blastococcus haudaquaticus]|uniref:Uncharacterized protein n=1 Tax=Blastococcus haudaquaticus TaxID=1938745 RepID=A0A286GHX6_9ACTN|nr:hypothetical protein [Blastococcus haudaquaticus]SOD95118.1 hypothetical protein SAMN06272739_1104 [Blastococcus haudaquaticus]